MNWFITGGEHTRQQVQRVIWRVRTSLDARRLRTAEIALGELGWQQADFPPQVEETIATINRIENQQGDLFNQSAEVATEISAQQQERAAQQADYDAARRALVAEITPVQAALDALETARSQQRTLSAALREHLPDLEKGQRQHRNTLEQLSRDFSPDHSPLEIGNERRRLEDLLNAAIASLSGAHEGLATAVEKIRALDGRIEADRPGLQALLEKLQTLDSVFNAADHERAQKLGTLQQRKAEIERQLSTLDHDKTGYFLIVGRCLADAEIPPMNQPAALHRVLDLRQALAARETALATSLAWSAAIPPGVLLKFYSTLGLLAVALLVAAYCAGR